MRARLSSLLPRGPADVVRQLALFCGAYWLYRLVRGTVDGDAAAAFAHARWIVSLERGLGVFVEPAVQRWASRTPWLIDGASWAYLNAHFTITTVALAWIYVARNERFYFVRNMFTVAMGLALLGYLLVPTAPPRLLPGAGFSDPVAALIGTSSPGSAAGALANPFAAVPSMHVAFALMLGLTLARIARRPWARALWCAYPAVVAFVVVATGNHWLFDVATGALTAAVSAVAAHVLLARARPHAWSWAPHPPLGPSPRAA